MKPAQSRAAREHPARSRGQAAGGIPAGWEPTAAGGAGAAGAGSDAAPSLSPQNGGTPLLYAVRGNHVKCVEALLGNGDDPRLGLGLDLLLRERRSSPPVTVGLLSQDMQLWGSPHPVPDLEGCCLGRAAVP